MARSSRQFSSCVLPACRASEKIRDSRERLTASQLANKQDLPNAMSLAEIALKLNAFGPNVHIQATCATTGDGLYEGLEWLATYRSSVTTKATSDVSLVRRIINRINGGKTSVASARAPATGETLTPTGETLTPTGETPETIPRESTAVAA
jgi:hypothetical protein